MKYYIDADHIQEFLTAGQIEYIDSDLAFEAEQHLERSFPLSGWSTIIDWDKVPSRSLCWNQVSDDEAVEWVRKTSAGQCSMGLLLFSPEQPCLVGPIEFMVRHLDELVWRAPGSRLLFGVERDASGNISFSRGVIEYNGKGELFASISEEGEKESVK